MALSFRRRDPPNASQQLKRVGRVVTGLSGFLLLCTLAWCVTEWRMDDKSHLVENRIFAALLISVTSWGLATGIELLRLRPWARLSMPVFQGLLCVCGALPVVVLIVVGFFKSNTGGVAVGRFAEAIGITAWFVLVFVTIGVYGTFLSGPLANCNVPRRKKVPG